MSGYKLGIINPDETLFSTSQRRRTGKFISFEDETRTEVFLHHQDSGKHFDNILQVDPLKGHCNGTVFRFRLRKKPSKLSQTIYDEPRVKKLFNEFSKEGHLALIFLKSLAKIEFYFRGKGNKSATLLYSFVAKQENGEVERKEETKFMSKVKNAYKYKKPDAHLSIKNTTIVASRQKSRKETQYYILNYYAGDALEEESELTTKKEARKLGYIPLVGIACEISSRMLSNGHVYCTLPLPIFKEKTTGLPVHVNGFFALAADRKDLKWCTTSETARSDADVSWNMFLIAKVLPKAYVEMFQYLRDNEGLNLTTDQIYGMLPDLRETDENWQMLAKNTLFQVFKERCVYSTGRESWISIKDAYFQDTKRDGYTAAYTFLKLCHLPVVSVQGHIDDAITKFKLPSSTFTPYTVRNAVARAQHLLHKLRSTEREDLLKYMLEFPKDVLSLIGAPVLPLEDDRFASPQKNHRDLKLFITTKEHSKHLVPGCEGRLIKTGIDKDLKKTLAEIAGKSKCALI